MKISHGGLLPSSSVPVPPFSATASLTSGAAFSAFSVGSDFSVLATFVDEPRSGRVTGPDFLSVLSLFSGLSVFEGRAALSTGGGSGVGSLAAVATEPFAFSSVTSIGYWSAPVKTIGRVIET